MRVTAGVLLAVVALGVTGSGAGGPARAKSKAMGADPCASEGPAPGPGSLDPFRPPAPKALELNAAGTIPYRQGKWDEARAQYRAAEAADPEFLAPKLNVACSFVRQERFAEATAEVVALLDRAYVPWAREILDAADLGALKVRPEMKEIERAMAAAAARWGEGLDASVLFVARQRPALRVPDGPGVFILNPHQEVWAFTPRTRRYRQLTAEDGHVVAFAPSFDKRSIVYVTAEKLVRGAKRDDHALRGVAVRRLRLATMALGPRNPIVGDVRELYIYDRILGDTGVGRLWPTRFVPVRANLTNDETSLLLVGEDGRLGKLHMSLKVGNLCAKLTPTGIEGPRTVTLEGCATVAAPAGKNGDPPGLTFKPHRGEPLRLSAPFGAGLFGMPIP